MKRSPDIQTKSGNGLKIPIKENNWAEVWWSWWPYLFWRPASHETVSWYSN